MASHQEKGGVKALRQKILVAIYNVRAPTCAYVMHRWASTGTSLHDVALYVRENVAGKVRVKSLREKARTRYAKKGKSRREDANVGLPIQIFSY